MSISAAQQHFDNAEGFEKNGLLQEAIESYKKAIKVDTSFVSAYYNLALAYHQAQQPDQAIVNLKKVTELDTGDASAFNNLGVLYVAMNRLNDAKRCFEKALSIEGDYQDARDNLEKVLQKLQKSSRMILNKLYDERELERSEIQHLIKEIVFFASQHSLEFNPLKWFEYSYAILYSGHRHRGKVLDIGSAKSVFPYYLTAKGYDVTTIDIADYEYRMRIGHEFNVKSLVGDLRVFRPELTEEFDLITNLSVIEHIDEDTKVVLILAKYLKPGGVMVISSDFYDRYIEYPDANRIIVQDRPQGSHTDSRVYTEDMFLKRIIQPLEEVGVERLGFTNYKNVDITNPAERSVRGLYTFGVACLRKPV